MRVVNLTLTAILYVPFAFGTPASSRTLGSVIHERRADNPEWRLMRRAEGDVLIPLRIALKQSNLDELPDFLLAVSDPSSPTYGSHWTPEKVVDIFSPSQETHKSVHEWLEIAGVEESRIKTSRNGAWIEIQAATIDEAERLLQAEYHIFENHNGEQQLACHSYTLPQNIATHVDFITPTVQPNMAGSYPMRSTPKMVKRDVPKDVLTRALSGPLTGCDIAIVPNCLHALYNMTYTPQATDRNSLGVVSYVPDTFLQSDLNIFFANVSPSLVGHSPLVVSINNGSIATDATSKLGEIAVDLEYTMALTEPQNVTLLQVGGTAPGQLPSFNDWLDAVDGSYCTSDGGDDFTYDPQLPNPFPGGLMEHSCGITHAPNVVSNSQGFQENRFSQFYLQRQCNEFAKLGLMGVTVLYGSGDQGTAQGGYCLDENKSVNLNATNFNPSWPSSCPWVTSVGGTQLLTNATIGSGTQEAAWNAVRDPNIFKSSGGGFSNHFSTPSYQKSTVDKYLNALKKSNSALLKNFNQNGRAYPDLSAMASDIGAISGGSIALGSGTSFSTPIVAAVITLVNDARIAAGKKPVGFINPTIYSPAFATAFNDVISGTIQGCKGQQGVSDGGFPAMSGWDPATGLGTPNLGLLIEKWLSLP